MADLRRRRSVSSTFLSELLARQLSELTVGGERPLEVVDLGGGTGGLATELAEAGHQVTVIDPSPDALGSLLRRTEGRGLAGRIQGVQGDAADLVGLVGPHRVDVVVCHRVLEVVDSPSTALQAMRTVLRPGGVLSLLVTQRHAAVLSQALAGNVAAARQIFADRSRFDHDQVLGLVREAGFTVLASHGVGSLADHVPETVVESRAGAHAELLELERAVSQDPAFRALAPSVHVFAQVPLAG